MYTNVHHITVPIATQACTYCNVPIISHVHTYYSGIRSVYSDTFHTPSEQQRRELFHCPVPPTTRVKGQLLGTAVGISHTCTS